MYIKNIQLENVAPIQKLDFEFPFTDNGTPKPVIIVGQNGSGKSIFISYIVNTLIHAKQLIYENSEMEREKVYKYRSPQYIRVGTNYYFAKLKFESDFESVEWQLNKPKQDFGAENNPIPHQEDFGHIRENDHSVFWSNFQNNRKTLEDLIEQNCILYFPPNRFEEPAWLNYDNLIARARFSETKHIQGLSNRSIIQYSPLTQNKDWLLDVLFDRQTFEIRTGLSPLPMPLPQNINIPIFAGYSGQSSTLYDAIINVLRLILRTEQPVRFGVGKRANRSIAVMQGDRQLIPNIFQLSTGESLVLNLFLSVLRDYDIATNNFQGLEEVRGIVLIDEIDLHLHTDMQFKILPSLIKQFPKVQFIITTHSPLFLLGMQSEFSDDGFTILSLPEGKQIGIERFEEFQNAWNTFKQSSAYQDDIKRILDETHKSMVFVEGDYDIRYIEKSAELLGKEHILDAIALKDGGGFGNLDNIWKSFESPVVKALTKNALLLYDCDIQKNGAEKGKVSKRIVPTNPHNPILKGVENLFSVETIEKARNHSPKFIDVTPAITRIERGEQVAVPEKLEVNRNEKRNLCDWICENGTRDDFEGFEQIFQILEEFLRQGEQV